MKSHAECPLASTLAQRIREERVDLTQRWLDRIAARVTLDPKHVFPANDALDHIPVLMQGIADYVEDPADEISADVPVIAKAMELGELRLHQGFDAHEILKEYEILGGVLFSFIAREVEQRTEPCPADELLMVSHRLFRAICVIEQVTTSHYLRAVNDKVSEREEQLRSFNRLVSHELKNKVGAVLGAGELVREAWLPDHERDKFVRIIIENAQALQQMLDNLVALSKLDGDSRRQRNILLREAVAEVFRQLRELARAHKVGLSVIGELPRVEVNAAAVELCLSNYLSNAIKYSDPSQAERWARVSAALERAPEGDDEWQLVVRVQDNGLGVPAADRDRLFERFFRGTSAAENIDGTGLGLSLVRETVEAIGGRAWAEWPEHGSLFAFALPCRRHEDGRAAEQIFHQPRPNYGHRTKAV